MNPESPAKRPSRRHRKKRSALDGGDPAHGPPHSDENANLDAPPANTTATHPPVTSSIGDPLTPSPKVGAATSAPGRCQKKLIDLYDSDLTVVSINTPVHSLEHVPSHDQRERDQHPPFVVCREYESTGSCRRGNECSNVHGVMSADPPPKLVHVNLLCETLESARYPRLSPGAILCIMAPNGRPPAQEVASEFIFVTQGSTMSSLVENSTSHKPLSHCAHFYFNRVCNRGADCSFIHVVSIGDARITTTAAPSPPSSRRQQKLKPSPATATMAVGQPTHSNLSHVDPEHHHSVHDLPLIEISRASPQEPEAQVDLPIEAQQVVQRPGASASLMRTVHERDRGLLGSPPNPSPATSEPLQEIPGSLHGSFACTSNTTPPTVEEAYEGEPRLRGLTPTTSRNATPKRSDSFRSTSSVLQLPRSPSLRSVTVGCKTLLFATVAAGAQPKDKDGCSPSASDTAGSDAGGSVTTPVGFRHNPYGPPSRNATPTTD